MCDRCRGRETQESWRKPLRLRRIPSDGTEGGIPFTLRLGIPLTRTSGRSHEIRILLSRLGWIPRDFPPLPIPVTGISSSLHAFLDELEVQDLIAPLLFLLFIQSTPHGRTHEIRRCVSRTAARENRSVEEGSLAGRVSTDRHGISVPCKARWMRGMEMCARVFLPSRQSIFAPVRGEKSPGTKTATVPVAGGGGGGGGRIMVRGRTCQPDLVEGLRHEDSGLQSDTPIRVREQSHEDLGCPRQRR